MNPGDLVRSTADTAPSWRRNQFAITTAGFIGFMGFTLVMPFLPLYFRELGVTDVGAIAIWTGASLGVTPGITAICAPVWGALADRFGRKIMLVRSLVSFIVVMTAMAFVTAPWQVLALRATQGLFAGYGALTITMVVESVPADRVARAIGFVQTAQRLAPTVGPVLGGALAHVVGLRQAFLVSTVLYVVALGLVLVMYQETPRRQSTGPAPATRGLGVGEVLRLGSFPVLLTLIFGLQLADRSLGPILPLFVAELGEPLARVPLTAGALFSIVAFSGAAGHHLSGRLLDWLSGRRVIAGGVCCALAGFGILAASSGLTGLLVGAPFLGAGSGIAMTGLYSRASRSIPRGMEGRAFGVLTSASMAGSALSPLYAGLVANVSLRAVFVIDALAVAVLLALIGSRRGEALRTSRPLDPTSA